ncbi:VOC family protein [Mumia sp. zg.B53]|uniref:VOC family protein n=1 Tax=unclassified Mumia TaxID=2621872 RepID=UPI001C6E69EE|nr:MULTISPECIES: VOC family protein [unclassified Mumia]MBW9208215.1 VOC family protein [Mumia sp. zg.B21]MBW9216170.1 VOC family protein [Mumia sp. zg.B53]
MDIRAKYFPITVDDVDAAIGFYRDALGLEVVNDVESDGHRWVSLGFPGQQGVTVVLSDPGAGRSEDDGDSLHRLVAKGSGPGPYVFSTSDLDALFDKVSSSGVDVLQEPMDQPWGPRDCAFRDPAGNLIRVDQLT